MAEIVLRVVADAFVNGRDIMDTGAAMMGLGGDNGLCGACGREMMHEVPFRDLLVNMLFRCSCGALNEIPKDS